MYQNKKTYTVEEARKKLESYCAYQERSHQEIEQKLNSLNLIPEAQRQITLHLLENDFLNEERFAKTYVSGKFRIKRWGKRRLTLELKRKNVSKYNINQALKEITNSEYIDAFNALAEKKFYSLKEIVPIKKKKKLADYLLYRGWESHLVYEKINELIKK